jgi:P-type Ca2+ transporter type 2C
MRLGVETIHAAVRGRARYRVAGLYRSESLRLFLHAELSACRDVRRVSGSTLTGNILVLFDPAVATAAVAARIETLLERYRTAARSRARAEPTVRPRPARDTAVSRVRGWLTRQVGRASGQPWHAMEPDAVLKALRTSPTAGLSSQTARKALARFGPNVLTPLPRRRAIEILIGQLCSLPIVLLGLSALLSLLTSGLADAVVIAAVVGANAAIGYVTESAVERSITSLNGQATGDVLVVRDGRPQRVEEGRVVPGDILILRRGDRVVADSRIIEAEQLSIDESALTGESLPVAKSPAALGLARAPLAERTDMAYRGTVVTGGQGLGVVVGTGAATEAGKVQHLVGQASAPRTPMQQDLDRLGRQLALASALLCGGVFALGVLRGFGLLAMLKTAISLAVAAVPEGLPTIATTVLALGVRNLRRRGVLVRRLDAVEALGTVDTICLDKTGTLTLNQMSLVEVHVGLRRLRADRGRFLTDEGEIRPSDAPELHALLQVAVLCNETALAAHNGSYRLDGSPTENALVLAAIGSGLDVAGIRASHPLLRTLHRSERRSYMTTRHAGVLRVALEVEGSPAAPPNGRQLVALKGNPLEVLARCAYYVKDGRHRPLAEAERRAVERENERMAGDGLRILGVAYRHVEGQTGDDAVDGGFVWLGLVAMADPLRAGVREVIRAFHDAGIATVLITGDQVPTARAVARDLGIAGGATPELLDSTRLGGAEPGRLAALPGRAQVFARVSPAQKLEVVRALQAARKVVAMTGDGINDAPALKAADVGIAMGATGTVVARELADVILEDDRLETLVVAVREGRASYQNIRKAVRFLLTTNLSEILLMALALATGARPPLTAMQLLWINLVTDVLPALGLALEPPEPGVMNRPPRGLREPMIGPRELGTMAGEATAIALSAMGAYGYARARQGAGAAASGFAFLSLTSSQLLHALSARASAATVLDRHGGLPNRFLALALGGSFALQAAAVAIPWLRRVLGVTPPGLVDGIVLAGTSLLPLGVSEALKTSAGTGRTAVRLGTSAA